MSNPSQPDLAADIQQERRLEDRHVVHWPLRMGWTSGTGPQFAAGRTLDLTLGGVRVAVGHNFAVGEKVACRLSVGPWHGNNSVFDIDAFARIVHCNYSSQHQGFEVGLQFQSFSGDGKAQLAKVVEALARGVSGVAVAKPRH